MKELKKIFLFVHPLASEYQAKYLSPPLYEKWKQLIVEEGRDDEKGICILSTGKKDDPRTKEFENFALKHFGARVLLSIPTIKILRLWFYWLRT